MKFSNWRCQDKKILQLFHPIHYFLIITHLLWPLCWLYIFLLFYVLWLFKCCCYCFYYYYSHKHWFILFLLLLLDITLKFHYNIYNGIIIIITFSSFIYSSSFYFSLFSCFLPFLNLSFDLCLSPFVLMASVCVGGFLAAWGLSFLWWVFICDGVLSCASWFRIKVWRFIIIIKLAVRSRHLSQAQHFLTYFSTWLDYTSNLDILLCLLRRLC